MKQFIKKNFAIVLAFLLPVSLIVFVALSAYLPSLFISTKYNFLYVSCTNNTNYYTYDCANYLKQHATVVNDKLLVTPIDPVQDLNSNKIPDMQEGYNIHIFLHDTKNNESKEITNEEAQSLELNNLLTSPDGVTVSSNYSYSGGGDLFFFGGGHSSFGYYLMKGKSKKKLNLINTTDQYYNQNNFQFIGWVLPGRN